MQFKIQNKRFKSFVLNQNLIEFSIAATLTCLSADRSPENNQILLNSSTKAGLFLKRSRKELK
jgi:hypothetical protein